VAGRYFSGLLHFVRKDENQDIPSPSSRAAFSGAAIRGSCSRLRVTPFNVIASELRSQRRKRRHLHSVIASRVNGVAIQGGFSLSLQTLSFSCEPRKRRGGLVFFWIVHFVRKDENQDILSPSSRAV